MGAEPYNDYEIDNFLCGTDVFVCLLMEALLHGF